MTDGGEVEVRDAQDVGVTVASFDMQGDFVEVTLAAGTESVAVSGPREHVRAVLQRALDEIA